ncbi:MAG: zinc-binding alcohol dehydrogenase [Pseudomonadota bacterium]
MRTTTLWIEAPDVVRLRRGVLEDPSDGDVLVRTRFSGISRGTEALVLAGRVPPTEHDRMRAPFMQGQFPAPIAYGYISVGCVEAGPPDLLGREVFCLYPHQDRYVVPAAAVAPLPPELPASRAVLAANMETALNVVWDAGIGPGDRIAVVGAGVVGLLSAWLASRIPGTDVAVIDIADSRSAICAELGLAFSPPHAAPQDCDVVIHASGHESGLDTAIGCAGFEARIIEASWHGSGQTRVPLGGAFHSRRLAIVSSQVGSIPAERRARWSYRRRLAKALDLLRDARLDALITGESAFADLPDHYGAILKDPNTLCHRIRYD